MLTTTKAIAIVEEKLTHVMSLLHIADNPQNRIMILNNMKTETAEASTFAERAVNLAVLSLLADAHRAAIAASN